MTGNPLDSPVPPSLRLLVAVAMSIAGLIGGTVAGRSLNLPWPAALLLGALAAAVLALLAWRSPEMFFKNRP
jgi:hypothetical protein